MADDEELDAMRQTWEALEPLDEDAQQRVMSWLASKLGLEGLQASGGAGLGSGFDDRSGAELLRGLGGSLGGIKQFMKAKSPYNDVLRVTALAYYLSNSGDGSGFETKALPKARQDAAIANFNVSRAASNAHRSGYLTSAGKRGLVQVTADGEAIVEALPDKQKVAEVISQRSKRTRRRRAARKKS